MVTQTSVSETSPQTLCCIEPGVSFRFSQSQDSKGKPRFRMLAYTGAEMKNEFWGRVIVDLEGLKVPNRKLPALLAHDPSRIVGWHDRIAVDDKGIHSEGVFSQTTTDGQEIQALAKEGFPWQASIVIAPKVTEVVKDQAIVRVNGRSFAGPGTIFRKSELREISFVTFGADARTKVLAATATPIPAGADPEHSLRAAFRADPDHQDFLKLAEGDEKAAFASWRAYLAAEQKGFVQVMAKNICGAND